MPNTMKIGTNLGKGGLNYESVRIPYLNVMKQTTRWGTVSGSTYNVDTHEVGLLYNSFLDSDNYITTFGTGPGAHSFTAISTLMFVNWQSPYYRSGQYVFRYTGTGTFDFYKDATVNVGASAANRIVMDVVPTAAGIGIAQTATGAGAAQARDFALMHINDEAAYLAGEIFTPANVLLWKEMTKNGGAIRFMKEFSIDGTQTQVDWADRTLESNCFWSGSRKNIIYNGCDPEASLEPPPYEVCAKLMIKLNCDGWVCIPPNATDDYIEQMATLFHTQLAGTSLKVYVEYANEMWNPGALGAMHVADITASFASNQMIVTAITPNTFGGPFLRPGMAVYDNVSGGLPISPGDGISQVVIKSQASGTTGGIGTYNLDPITPVGTVSSRPIEIVLKGSSTVAVACANRWPIFGGSTISTVNLNKRYSCYGATRSANLWKAAWGADAARVIRVYGGMCGDNSYNTGNLPQLGNGDSAPSATFNGTLSGFNLTVNSGLSGTVAIGQLVTGAGVPAATYIQSGSGTSWVVNHSGTATGVSMSTIYWTGTVASNMDALAVGPYINTSDGTTFVNSGDSLTTLFTKLNTILNSLLTSNVSLNASTAASYGLALMAYEAGTQVIGTQAAANDGGTLATANILLESAARDPRMQTLITNLLTGLQSQGMTLCMYYSDIAQYDFGLGHDWGALRSPYDTTSYKYAALAAFNAVAGQIMRLRFRLHL